MAGAGLALAATAVPLPAAASGAGTVSVSGTGNSSAVVTLTKPLALSYRPDDRLGGPATGRLRQPYLGYAITPVGENRVLFGAVRFAAVEKTTGFIDAVPLSPNDTTLSPGRYRVVLLGAGPTQLRLRTKRPADALAWRTTTRAAVQVDIAALTSATLSQPTLLSHRQPTTVTTRTFVLQGLVGQVGGVDARNFCLTVPGALTCFGGYPKDTVDAVPGPGAGAFIGGVGGVSDGAFRSFQPGQLPAGSYDALYYSTGSASLPAPVSVLLRLSS